MLWSISKNQNSRWLLLNICFQSPCQLLSVQEYSIHPEYQDEFNKLMDSIVEEFGPIPTEDSTSQSKGKDEDETDPNKGKDGEEKKTQPGPVKKRKNSGGGGGSGKKSKLMVPKSRPLSQLVLRELFWMSPWWMPRSKVSTYTSRRAAKSMSSTRAARKPTWRLASSCAAMAKANGACKLALRTRATRQRRCFSTLMALKPWYLGASFYSSHAHCCKLKSSKVKGLQY